MAEVEVMWPEKSSSTSILLLNLNYSNYHYYSSNLLLKFYLIIKQLALVFIIPQLIKWSVLNNLFTGT